MLTCCFFGHKDAPPTVKERLLMVVEELIENGVKYFWVGHNGKFDYYVLEVLRVMEKEYPHIKYDVVLSYFPLEKRKLPEYVTLDEIYFPEVLESCHPKYAISKRNKWMVDDSDVVVTYITHPGGGAIKFAEYAEKRGKKVINIADITD